MNDLDAHLINGVRKIVAKVYYFVVILFSYSQDQSRSALV